MRGCRRATYVKHASTQGREHVSMQARLVCDLAGSLFSTSTKLAYPNEDKNSFNFLKALQSLVNVTTSKDFVF